MSRFEMTCIMCGQKFDPKDQAVCQSCPLGKGCSMVCCPNCGYQTINPSQSVLAKIATSIFSSGNNHNTANTSEEN
jgi:predicted RNA-binding Zn-ribbon protein involved in translation (DUF1610 family)